MCDYPSFQMFPSPLTVKLLIHSYGCDFIGIYVCDPFHSLRCDSLWWNECDLPLSKWLWSHSLGLMWATHFKGHEYPLFNLYNMPLLTMMWSTFVERCVTSASHLWMWLALLLKTVTLHRNSCEFLQVPHNCECIKMDRCDLVFNNRYHHFKHEVITHSIKHFYFLLS